MELSKKRLNLANDHFRLAVQTNPECHISVHVALAYCLFALENYDAAKKIILKAIERDVS